MRLMRSIALVSVLISSAMAFAAPPNSESFVVSGIHFGDSADQVQQVAKSLGLRLARAMEYLPRGEYPKAIASQQFRKPCPECSLNMPDPRFETLEVQYSRITGRVIAISRTLVFDKPVHVDQMRQTIADRFGKLATSDNGTFAWRRDGTQERKFEMDQHCGVGGAMPVLHRKPGCGFAAQFTYETARNNPELVTSQSLAVFDWKDYDEEMAAAEQSELDQKAKAVQDSKQREIPRI